MKLYYSPGACSLAVRIIINELGLPAEFEKVDLRSKKTETGADFLAVNIKGAVPTIALDDGSTLTENTVILQYLADSSKAYALLPAVGDFARYRVLIWVNYITTELHKTFGLLFNPNMPQNVKDEIVVPLILDKFRYVDNHLKKSSYLSGDTFSLPDAYLFVILRWAHYFKIDLTEYTALVSYFKELSKRPSIEKSLKEESI